MGINYLLSRLRLDHKKMISFDEFYAAFRPPKVRKQDPPLPPRSQPPSPFLNLFSGLTDVALCFLEGRSGACLAGATEAGHEDNVGSSGACAFEGKGQTEVRVRGDQRGRAIPASSRLSESRVGSWRDVAYITAGITGVTVHYPVAG